MSCWKKIKKFREAMKLLSIVFHVGLHVDFSSMKSALGLQAITFVCEVNLDSLFPFDQWEHLDCNGHGLSVLCVKRPLSDEFMTLSLHKHFNNMYTTQHHFQSVIFYLAIYQSKSCEFSMFSWMEFSKYNLSTIVKVDNIVTIGWICTNLDKAV